MAAPLHQQRCWESERNKLREHGSSDEHVECWKDEEDESYQDVSEGMRFASGCHVRSQKALKASAHTGTPNWSFVNVIYAANIIVSSLAKDNISHELICTLPMEAMKAVVIIEAMNAVAAVRDPVAWSQTSYMGTLIRMTLDL